MGRDERQARRDEKRQLKQAKRTELRRAPKRSFRLRDASAGRSFELVQGGPVRRIHFDAEQRDEVRPEPTHFEESIEVRRVYRPRHVAPMPEIEFEVDHLDSIRAGFRPKGVPVGRTDLRRRADLLYETDRGSVLGTSSPVSGRQVLYTQGESVLTRRRFTEAAVDAVIKDVRLDDDTIVRESVTEYVPRSRAEGRTTKQVRGRPVRRASPANATRVKPAPKAVPAAKAVRVAKAAPAAPGSQPQCVAVTPAGKQCRNPCRAGSQYCGAHKGFRPPSASALLAAAKDTKPRVKRAPDTKPGHGGATSKEGLQAQCAAITTDGKQCRNSSRHGSKYCGAHKGYQPAAAAQRLADTKPSTRGKDTKPTVRKR
jgi:hypothetical protein